MSETSETTDTIALQKLHACRYCDRRFKRRDHVQRHERRHTKETPYKCSCGQAYPRQYVTKLTIAAIISMFSLTKCSDLLTRHQKSAHSIEPRKAKRNSQAQHDRAAEGGQQNPTILPHLTGGGNLDDSFSTSINPNLGMNVHQKTATLPKQQQQTRSIQQSLNGNVAEVQLQVSEMLLHSMSGDTDFQYIDHGDVANQSYVCDASDVPLVAGKVAELSATHKPVFANENIIAEAGMETSSRGDNTFSFGNILPRLNHPFLDMDDLFANDNLFFSDVEIFKDSMMHPAEVDLSEVFAAPGFREESTIGTEYSDQQHTPTENSENPQANVFSRIGSPLPSVRHLPDSCGVPGRPRRPRESGPCWKVSQGDYLKLLASVDSYSEVLPTKFALPSRYTMSHYLERCINSLYKHQPCVHVPTFCVGTSTLELILAMCAVGAQLRFESHLGVTYFHASKALIMLKWRDHHEEGVLEALSHPDTVRSGTFAGPDQTSQSAAQNLMEIDSRPPLESDTWPRIEGSHSFARGHRLQTMQALLTLMSFGSWGPQTLLGEGIILQSLLAVLAREEGLAETDFVTDESLSLQQRWHAWINVEGMRRIKIIMYYFTNLQSLAYNMIPPIPTAEVQCYTPSTAHEWLAGNAQQWDEARSRSGVAAVPFQSAFQSLFQRGCGITGNSESVPAISALGNYALIFGILQCLYFLRQRHPVPFATRTDTDQSSLLRSEDTTSIIQALQKWQSSWEICPESTIEVEASVGPISFNSIACLRMAWFRLYADLGPSRNLATRDPELIVRIFTHGAPLQRHSQLIPVLLQAVHHLSVPVRLGIKFVARSQTLFWSVNQSLCTLECAVIINKWLRSLTSTIAHSPLTKQEKSLVSMLRAVVLESGFFVESDLPALAFSTTSPYTNTRRDSGRPANEPIHLGRDAADQDDNTTHHYGPAGAIDASPYDKLDSWHNSTVQKTTIPTPPTISNDTTEWQGQISALSAAVARLWAEIFSSNHVFDLVNTIGRALSIHSQMLNGRHSDTSLDRRLL